MNSIIHCTFDKECRLKFNHTNQKKEDMLLVRTH